MKANQKSALTFAEEWKKVDNEGGNLSRAYIELRKLARAAYGSRILEHTDEETALHAAIGETNPVEKQPIYDEAVIKAREHLESTAAQELRNTTADNPVSDSPTPTSAAATQTWCPHVGGLGPPFPYCPICAGLAPAAAISWSEPKQDYPGGPVYRVGTSHGVVMQEMKSRGIGSFWVLDDAAPAIFIRYGLTENKSPK